MADEQDEKSYKDRIDPGGELERQGRGLEALASFAPVKWFLKHRGMDTDDLLARSRELRQNITAPTSAPDRVAAVLSPLGWPYFSSVPHDAAEERNRCYAGSKEVSNTNIRANRAR